MYICGIEKMLLHIYIYVHDILCFFSVWYGIVSFYDMSTLDGLFKAEVSIFSATNHMVSSNFSEPFQNK